MIGEVLDAIILVVLAVIGLQRHAIVAHSIGSVLAKVGISTSWYFSIYCSPILIYCVFLDCLPRSAGGYRCGCFLGDALLGDALLRSAW